MIRSKPFFSIIIPALNEVKYLPHLLEDLTSQTFRDFEVLVVDGHSRDQTVAKAKLFARRLPHLTILQSPQPHVCVQRNLGAKKAHSEILVFLDADNSLPSYFLQGLKYRWESSHVDILACWFKPDIMKPSNETIATAVNLFLELQHTLKPTYLLESMFAITKSCFQTIGGFDESVNYAEGKSLIQSAISHGYTSKVVRDPVYTYSFRRLRKFGVLSMANRIAKMELSALLNQDLSKTKFTDLYPMQGGSFFDQSARARSRFLTNITKLLKNL